MGAFANVIGQALNSVRSIAGESVVYWRGTQSVSLQAVPGSSTFETTSVTEMPVLYASRDWIFQADELVLGGVPTTPKRGDLVKQTVGDKTTTFEVLSDGSQVFRYCDVGRSRIRVHTKEKATA